MAVEIGANWNWQCLKISIFPKTETETSLAANLRLTFQKAVTLWRLQTTVIVALSATPHQRTVGSFGFLAFHLQASIFPFQPYLHPASWTLDFDAPPSIVPWDLFRGDLAASLLSLIWYVKDSGVELDQPNFSGAICAQSANRLWTDYQQLMNYNEGCC